MCFIGEKIRDCPPQIKEVKYSLFSENLQSRGFVMPCSAAWRKIHKGCRAQPTPGARLMKLE